MSAGKDASWHHGCVSVPPAMAMEVVAQNIEEGNRQAVAEVQQSKGSA